MYTYSRELVTVLLGRASKGDKKKRKEFCWLFVAGLRCVRSRLGRCCVYMGVGACVGALRAENGEGLAPTLGEGHVLLPRGSFRQYFL